MRLLLILFLLTGMPFYCNSKKVPKYIRDRFTNCYNGKNTNIKTLIEINGHYTLKELYRVCSGVGVNMICKDTVQHHIVFYEDGTFIYNYWDLTTLENVASEDKLFEEWANNRIRDSKMYYVTFFWGIYRIERDTITTQYIFNPSLLSPWDAWEDKYVVLDRETIVMIPSATQPLYRTTKAERKEMAVEMAKRKFLPAKFKQSNNLPPPDSWLKKEAWTKCK
ncbi:MAG: hypothetical protein JSS64_02360 [Bacteroidetes bacterium]|nr:hypothetical protein [Bacteroidota bacterium]